MTLIRPTTFIAPITFKVHNGHTLVQKRAWEMVRIFSDHFVEPVFGMIETPNDISLTHRVPSNVNIISLTEGANGLIKLSSEVKRIINSCDSLQLRFPSIISWTIFKYALSNKKKIISSFHGDWADSFLKRDSNGFRKIKNRIAAFYVDRILKIVAKNSFILFCVGDSLKNKYGTFNSNSFPLFNYLHTENDISDPKPKCTKPPYKMLYVGLLEEYKGLSYLLESVKIMLSKGIDIRLTIVGQGSQECILRKIVKNNGLGEYVFFRGYVPFGSDLFSIYRNSDIFILPSISSEGMPKVVMEAMSQSLPVISTDVGSSRFILEGGKNGILIPPKHPAKISEAVERIISDHLFRERIILNGIEAARNNCISRQKSKIAELLHEKLPCIVGTPSYLESK